MSTLQENLDAIKLDKDTNLKPENLKKDITCLGVTGTYEGSGSTTEGIKQFSTIEEMQADTTAKEGDKAVVYRNEIQNMTADMEVTSITFPETVTLPAAFTGSANGSLRAVDSSVMFDGNCQLDQNSFRFDSWSESGMIRVEYTSTDGITYTRTRIQGDNGDLTNPVEVPACKVERQEEWNDNLGYFMQIGGGTFEGLYEGKLIIKQIQPIKMSTMVMDTETNVPNISDVITLNYNVDSFAEKIYPMVKYIDTSEGMNSHSRNPYCIYLKDNNTVSIIADGSSSSSVMLACPVFVNNTFKGLVAAAYDVTNFYEWQFNLNTGEYIGRNDITATNYTTFGSNTNKYYYTTEFNNYYYVGNMDWTGSSFSYVYSLLYNNTSYSADTLSMTGVNGIMYFLAPTQLNIKSSNQLLPGKKAYGNNGVVVGDGSIYENLDTTLINTNLLKVKLGNDSDGDSTAQLCGEHIKSTQNMISYSANTNGVNYVYYNDDEYTMPDFILSVKITEDTTVGVTYNSTNKILTASKYEFSTNTTTELCTITDSDLKNFDSTYNSIGLDATKENIYISARYYNSGYYLNCYKINLVDNTFVKMCSHFNKSSSELDYTNASIISPEQQAVFVDCKAGIKKFSFDGTSSVIKTKSDGVANYVNRAVHLHSYRYLQVLMETDGDYILYDTVTDTLLTETAHEYSYKNDILFEVNGKTYFHVGLTRYVVCYRKWSD